MAKVNLTKKDDSSIPSWDAGNLKRHAEKRTTESGACMKGMLGIESGNLLPGNLRQKSESVYSNATFGAEYEKKDQNRKSRTFGEFMSRTIQLFDREIFTVVIEKAANKFKTCFHYHFDKGVCQGKPVDAEDSGRQLLKAKSRIIRNETRGVIRNLNFIDTQGK